MLILKGDKVICFDTLLQVLILKGVALHKNCAKCGLPKEVLILKGVKVVCLDTVLQVLILKRVAWPRGAGRGPQKAWELASWSVQFKGHGSAN